MAHDDSQSHLDVGVSPPSLRDNFAISAATILLIAFFSFLGIYLLRPPASVPVSASPLEFSAGRAMSHLRVIARGPHQVGTSEHSAVRDYLLAQLAAEGLHHEVHKTTALNPVWSGEFRTGTVQNIIARLKGTTSAKAILLAGHYDSVSTGPGASDNGAAVVTLLETLRALRAGPALKNDVIFLFTDGEEAGLLGAHAFVAEHPWFKDVGLVLNFEARGNSGPSIMFETSDQNGRLIKGFAQAAPYPIANSLANEIYRLMPNDTDMTVFKSAGLSGLNFAYINGPTHYHTQLDNINEIDERSLQHHGSYALALTQHFGNLDLQDMREANAIYFDFLGLFFVHYPSAWVLPITIVITVAFVGLVVIGLRRGRLTVSGIALGISAFFLSLVIAPIVTALLWMLIRQMLNTFGDASQSAAYNSGLYFIGFVSLTAAMTFALYALFRKRVSVENLTVGGLFWWVILLVMISLFLPGASYLLTWPLLFSLPALAYMLAANGQPAISAKLLLLLFLGGLTGVVFLVPTIYQIFIGLTLSSISTIMMLLVLLLGLLIPHFKLMSFPRAWALPGALMLIGAGFILAAIISSGNDLKHPKFNSLFYGLNADTGRAIWGSSERKPDEWTSQVLSAGIQRKTLPEFFAANPVRYFLQAEAVSVALPAPHVELLGESINDGIRALRLRITSPRQAPIVSIYLDAATNVRGMSVNGKRIESRITPALNQNARPWNVRYYNAPAEGIELTLELNSSELIKIRVVDQTYGFPALPEKSIRPRPGNIIPARYQYNDSTFVSKSFTF